MRRRQKINKLKIKYARWWPVLWIKIKQGSGSMSAAAGKVCLFSEGAQGWRDGPLSQDLEEAEKQPGK